MPTRSSEAWSRQGRPRSWDPSSTPTLAMMAACSGVPSLLSNTSPAMSWCFVRLAVSAAMQSARVTLSFVAEVGMDRV
jgi:hypothetical protein